jgi:hypothetical protein
MARRRLPYTYEIYTKHPVRGTRGWDIQVGYVTGAPDREAALRVIKKTYGRLFDTVINLYQVTEVEPIHASHYLVIPYNNPRARKVIQGSTTVGRLGAFSPRPPEIPEPPEGSLIAEDMDEAWRLFEEEYGNEGAMYSHSTDAHHVFYLDEDGKRVFIPY